MTVEALFSSAPDFGENRPTTSTNINQAEASGRLVKWAIELGEYDLSYEPRSAIKAQALADFIAEFTPGARDAEQPIKASASCWKLYVDGSSSQEGSGAGLLLESPEGQELNYSLKFDFKASNNMAEYEALIAGLQLARKLGAQKLKVYSDCQNCPNVSNF